MSEPTIEFEDGEVLTLTGALALLEQHGGTRRPYSYRVESAANAATGYVIDLRAVELGSRSEAIRDLLARGAAAYAAERETA